MRSRVQEHRERVGLTRAQLAARAGTSRQTIWNLETQPNYQPSIALLHRIAAALAVPFVDLFELDSNGAAA